MKKRNLIKTKLVILVLKYADIDPTNPTCAWVFDDIANVGIAGATVKAEKDGKVIASTKTDADGNYTFTGLAKGTYTITAQKTGLRTASEPSDYDGKKTSLPLICLKPAVV
jgi:hypothetical protein